MADKYIPGTVAGFANPEEALQYMLQELEKISSALESVLAQQYEELQEPPVAPAERTLYFADGINWNPGHGRGLYTFLNGVWFPVAATAVPPPPPPEDEEPPPPPPDEEPPPEEEEPPGPPGPLPPEDGFAIPTFHCMGIYWTPPSRPSGDEAILEYRKTGTAPWKRAQNMWYDARNNQCRGSVFYLDSNTEYDFQFGLVLGTPIGSVRAKTRDENFPIGSTVNVASRNTTLNITEGGSPGAYKLYTPAGGIGASTLDMKNAQFHAVIIQAPFVILRGFIIKGSQGHAISMRAGARDCVIEHNDISEFGRLRNPPLSKATWPVQQDGDSGIHAFKVDISRLVIQYNRIHSPRYGTNSWDIGHPHGGNAVYFHDSGHNIVVRWNSFIGSLTGDHTKFFMDGFGSSDNFGAHGTPGFDSDVYGNYVSGCMDDGLECEGGQRNVRIWGNYVDMCPVMVGSTVVNTGPQYIFRNVHNRARKMFVSRTWDTDLRLYSIKAAAAVPGAAGRRFVFHNTTLQNPPDPGFNLTQGTETGISGLTNQPILQTKTRNNIFHVWKSHIQSIRTAGGVEGNSFNYDLYNGTLDITGQEANGIKATPTYQAGNGPEFLGKYRLQSGTSGHNAGEVLPNINDGFSGAAPDMGAHEDGAADLAYGWLNSGKGAGEPP